MSTMDVTVQSRPLPASMLPSAIACLAILGFAPYWNAGWGPIVDVSWLITVCEKVLDGQRLYVDVIETNPPFSVWLYILPVAAGRMLGIAPEAMVQGWTCACCLVGLGFGAWLAVMAFPQHRLSIVRGMPLVLVMLLLFPGNAFAQREHIGAALFMPLLALMAWRLALPGRRPPLPAAILAGALGSVIVLVKPHYAAMVLACSIHIAWRRRDLRLLFTPENWTIGAICVAYLAAVLVLHPQFLGSTLPLVADVYMPVVAYDYLWLGFWQQLVLPAAVLLPIAIWKRDRPLVVLPAIAAVIAGAVFFAQGKSNPYQLYPAILFATLGFLGFSIGLNLRRLATWVWLALTLNVGLVMWQPFMARQEPQDEFVDAIAALEIASPRVDAIGVSLSNGHPLTRLVGGRWMSVHPGDWLGGYALVLENAASERGDPTEAARYHAIAKAYRDSKHAELVANAPDVVVVRSQDGRWGRFWRADPRFATFLSHYRTIATHHGVTVMARQ